MNDPDRPLRLDAPREEALEHAAKLVAEAWRSFDRARPGEPRIDDRPQSLLRAELPAAGSSARGALDDAASVLDVSSAQPRPRFFAFEGSSGLEIGVIGHRLKPRDDAAPKTPKEVGEFVLKAVAVP